MVHRTAGGQVIDMNRIRLQNENAITVGNTNTNARGDRLGAGGQIVKKRDDIMRENLKRQQGSPLTNLPSSASAAAPAAFSIDPDPVVEELPPVPGIENEAEHYNEALAKSLALAERLKEQRKLQDEASNQTKPDSQQP
jgi:hypothetical protein